MGGRAGGGASGGMGKGSRGASARSNQLANQYLGGVNNPALKKELASALADYEKEFGLPAGLTVTMGGTDALGKINGMNQMHLNSEYESGKRTPAEARKTFIHELTHGIDRTDTNRKGNISGIVTKGASVKGVLKSENKGFEKKLTSAYKHFKSHYGSSDTKAIGRYALKSKHEFFAEALSSHMTGTQNKYTTFAYNLAKSMSGK